MPKENLSEEVLDFIKSSQVQNKKILYFAMGSSSNEKLVKKILKQLLKFEFQIIAPISKYLSKESFSESALQLLIVDKVPAHLIGEHVDFSILHGGEGTVQTACLSGKPFIGIPLQYEQEVNVRFCEAFGNAKYLHPSQINAKNLNQAISDLLNSDATSKAEELKELFSIDGSEIVANWMDDYLTKQKEKAI